MQDNVKERWVELCEQASVEQDSKKLQKLVQEIDSLLREKRERIDEAGAVTRGTDVRQGRRGACKNDSRAGKQRSFDCCLNESPTPTNWHKML
jgi:hypothetical protein